MKKVLLYLHLWCGLVAAVFLLLLGVSGAIVAFENELDRALNAHLYYVQPQAQALPLEVIRQKLESAYPGSKVAGFQLPERSDLSLFVQLIDNSRKRTALAVDPYTGAVLGNADEGNHFISQVHQFHTHLLAGEAGKQIVGWSGVLLLLLSISGIILWWPAKLFRLRWSGSGKRFNFELHNTVGVTSSLFLFIFAWTAVCIHWERPVGEFATRISGQTRKAAVPRNATTTSSQAVVSSSGSASLKNDTNTRAGAPGLLRASSAQSVGQAAPISGTPLSADQLLAVAHDRLPEARVTILLLPGNAKAPANLILKFPEDHTPAGRSRMSIDAYTGQILRMQSSREMPAAVKYAQMWNREVHTGDIFNLPTRILAAFFSLMLPVLAISGPLMWWQRRRVS